MKQNICTNLLPTDRSLLKVILLGIITLGIYPIIINSRISKDINIIASNHDGLHTMHYCLVYFLFSWLTIGVYPLIWFHRLSERISNEIKRRGITYQFDVADFWLWAVLGSIFIVGPYIYVHKLLTAMNLLSSDYNQTVNIEESVPEKTTKLPSTFPNMLLSLTLIALVAAAALAGVYMLTKDPIAAAMVEKQQSAIMQVLPEVEGDIRIAEAEESNGVTLYKAYVGEEWIGTAVEASTEGNQNMPFGGTFRLMVGFNNVGDVVKYVVLEHSETPGLGAKMDKWFCDTTKLSRSIINRNPSDETFVIQKAGESRGGVDAITASTITSRAFLEVVVKAYNGIAQQPMPIEATSGATQLTTEEGGQQ